MSSLLTKTCPNCNVFFYTFPSINQKHCSAKCGFEFKVKRTIEIKKRPCKICNKIFVPKRIDTPGLFCSYKCSAQSRVKKVMYWHGYKWIYLPTHPNAGVKGYYSEHRYIMEQHIGRILSKKEVIHHINHNKMDNHIENLKLYSSGGQHIKENHFKLIPHNKKLDRTQAMQIRTKYANKTYTMKTLAKEYNVSPSHICYIIHNKVWKY